MKGLVWVVVIGLLSVCVLVPLDPAVTLEPLSATLDDIQKSVPPATDSRLDVYFPSQGVNCHAWLFLPESPDSIPPPVIVMAHGIGSQKDFGLVSYAEEFAAKGFAAFVFDYRGFGASGGFPRNLIDPVRLVQDFHAAVDFIESSPNELKDRVDCSKIVLWGTSFGGGHVITTAAQRNNDTAIVGVISHIPHLNGRLATLAAIKRRGIFGALRIGLASLQHSARTFVGLPGVYIKIAGTTEELAVMNLTPDELKLYLDKIPKKPLGNWENKTPASIALKVGRYSPLDWLISENIPVPVLVVAGTQDIMCPVDAPALEEALKKHAGAGSQLFLEEMSHFNAYFGKKKVILAKMIEFLNKVVFKTESSG